MSAAEPLEGQNTLPAEFPEPVMTADILIEQYLKEGLTQLAYFSRNLSIFDADGNRRDEDGNETDEARTLRIARGNMHLFSYLVDAVIVDLIQQIQGVNPTWADKAANDLHHRLEDGEYHSEMMWQWATQRGLDPEEITEKAKAQYAEKEAS